MKKLVNSITMAYDEDVSKRDKEIMIKKQCYFVELYRDVKK